MPIRCLNLNLYFGITIAISTLITLSNIYLFVCDMFPVDWIEQNDRQGKRAEGVVKSLRSDWSDQREEKGRDKLLSI